MSIPVAHVASVADSGLVRVIFRFANHTTRTVLIDPLTKAQQVESNGMAELDAVTGAPTPTWWNG